MCRRRKESTEKVFVCLNLHSMTLLNMHYYEKPATELVIYTQGSGFKVVVVDISVEKIYTSEGLH